MQAYYRNDIVRNLNLLQHYFSNKNLTKAIIEYTLNGFYNIYKMITNVGNKNYDNLEGILSKFSELLLNIFNKNIEIKSIMSLGFSPILFRPKSNIVIVLISL